jgi:hypothetical protein
VLIIASVGMPTLPRSGIFLGNLGRLRSSENAIKETKENEANCVLSLQHHQGILPCADGMHPKLGLKTRRFPQAPLLCFRTVSA